MSLPPALRAALLPLMLLSWALVLTSTLLRLNQPAAPTGLATPLAGLLALAVFTAATFAYQRSRPDPLRGTDFVGLLRRLLLGPGLLVLVCGVCYLLERFLVQERPGYEQQFFAASYTLNAGLFILLLTYSTYAWRSLVLFRSSSQLRTQWRAFEVLLALVLVRLFVPTFSPVANFITLGLIALIGVYMSGNQRWVAYLNRRQKWEVLLLQLGLLLSLMGFSAYFLHVGSRLQGIVPVQQQDFILNLTLMATFFSGMGLLVTLFNLPTAGVFEQKREEILSLQRLTQLIQKGQSEQEVYTMLFDAAVQTVSADAAWLEIDDETLPLENRAYNVRPEQSTLIRNLLAEYNLSQIEYLNNDLPNSSGFRTLDLGFGSLLVMPLRSAKRQYGSLYLLKEQRHGFDRESLSILQTFTSQTVLSIENLQLLAASIQSERVKEELKIASSVQDSLIPKELPTDNWFEISSHALAAKEVGGDFYDFLHLPGRRLAILIGDVSGKGVTAAFHMAQMKGIFHALMQENPLARDEREKFPVPSKFMAMANRALVHCLERSSFITAALYIIDYEHGGFVFARAGHCHTLYYHSIKEEVSYFRTAGLGLGIIRTDSYEKHIKNQFYDYNPGDVMVIYTDGIVEARGANQEEYGEERLQQMLERTYYLEASEIKEQMLADLNEFSKGQPMHDDQTLLVIKFKAAQPETSN
ncbi:PP2C family protein-serine/threonine phosphatase [Hymenobacter sp. BT175]|uniref:PP2C family protein-serine/threonine phosphatase n=1 Tax=Hymenobacter translucens TaxID=2886507 RepID=UPI001D0E37B0|nr:PP2C family protein-serine/threonine phosphatase [Hymenobacter translucens]MCC2548424.1 PP2C family protein-serine/threonine phosphatase [Hymenobacter translucens]